MPTISKIRLTNIVYDDGNKRYNDELFIFDGHNSAIILENGGGKTVLIHTALQAIFPHVDLANRKIKHTLVVQNEPAHIAIEWINKEHPRNYVVTAVSINATKQGIDSLRYVYEYGENDPNGITNMPFVKESADGKRPAVRGEMQDYYGHMRDTTLSARTFSTITEYRTYIEENYQIIASEWDNIIKINSSEGGVEAFFDQCKTTNQLFDRLLIPTVEDSIEGHKESTFADMFEQQHESLKNYLSLKETIEENKQIQAKLNIYVDHYEHLHQVEEKYRQTKSQVKGLWEAALTENKAMQSELKNLRNQMDEWDAKQVHHKIKEASYHIGLEKQKHEQLVNDHDEVEIKQAELSESNNIAINERLTLEVAKYKQQQTELEVYLAEIRHQLATLDESVEAEEINEQLTEVKQTLRGWYEQRLETLSKEKRDIQYELNPINRQIDQLTEMVDEMTKERDQLNAAEGQQVGIIESSEKEIAHIKQEILANPKEEQVEQKLKEWHERSQNLDEKIIDLNKLRKQAFDSDKIESEAKEALTTELQLLKSKQQHLTYDLDQFELAEKQIISHLGDIRPQWKSLTNVYTTEHSISQRIEEQLTKLKKDQDRYLSAERLAYRFVDDYEEQAVFFADPYVEQNIQAWKNEFDYLVMGIEYLSALDPEEEQQLKSYPFWSNTLITTKKEQQKVIKKLHSNRDQLQYPILVLTTEAALTINAEQYLEWITPNHWQHNIVAKNFTDWKEALSQHAKEIRHRRENNNREIKRWEMLENRVSEFHENYPYQELLAKQTERADLNNQIESLTMKLEHTDRRLLGYQREITELTETIEASSAEKRGLDLIIEKGMRFTRHQDNVKQAREKQQMIGIEITVLTKKITKLIEKKALFEADKANLRERIAGFAQQEISLKSEDDYDKVSSFTPIYTDDHRGLILDRLKTFEMKAQDINRSREAWEVRQETTEKELKRLTAQIELILKDNQTLDLTKVFPSDGDQLIEKLLKEHQRLMTAIDKQKVELAKRKTKRDKQAGKVETIVDQFNKKYPDDEIQVFKESLTKVEAELSKQASELLKQKQFLDQSLSRVEQELIKIKKAIHLLENHIERHHFNAPDIEAVRLTPNQLRDYTYQREQTVKRATDSLKADLNIVEQEQNGVRNEQHKFKSFCKNYISNIKLQQMAITGIETKLNYTDVVNFKQNMTKSIERSSQYANEHIRASDKILQSFINQIHTHLINVTEELAQIPKKTRVKVNDTWKQIFEFKIPDWDRELGLSRLRDHIEWILNNLNQEDDTLDNGLEDKAAIRKKIESWLESKQLLQIVMQSETMRVSCRKVTNDNQVSSRPHSWEQSNIWSGGERWSKNMTLFLGILNYVAEKKGYQTGDRKRQRAVILDNPFGAASSDHVLSPVFFVAEQLGFQMIALTAHAEGKFLQDYFPVIYSCRLRQTTDASKQVMETSKQLNYAYFEDHEPPEMDRLQQVEQMDLFEQ